MIVILFIGLMFLTLVDVIFKEYSKGKSLYRYSYLIRHLKQAPYILFLTFLLGIVSYHYISYRLSVYQITDYIYSGKSVSEKPNFDLHLFFRSFCGNANSANRYYLYANAASIGFDSPDPNIRAKSLLASLYVYDGLNYPNNGPFFIVLKHAKEDSSPIVQKVFMENDCSYFLEK